jgi:hypothetical protein
MSRPHNLARQAYLAVPSAVLFALLAGARGPADRVDSPQGEAPAGLLSPTLPDDLRFDETGAVDKDRPAFNNFSWRNFIALNWPARAGKRGEPDTGKNFGDRADQVVWGSWKSLGELYPTDHLPTEWESFDAAVAAHQFDKDGKPTLSRIDQLPDKGAGRKKILVQVTRLGKVNEGGFVASQQGPLIAQNRTYVRYEVRVNRVAYEFITGNKYYLRENLPSEKGLAPMAFPPGSVVVKAAWMELTAGDDRGRFYHLPADVAEWTKDGRATLRKAVVVGLVGLHIAHKTPTRPSWVWSTFEHVDNTEPGPGATRASFSRNDPTTPNDNGFDYQPAPVPPRTPLPANTKPVDVLRINRIHSATQRVNFRYHQLKGVRGTVWENYRLVATQWVAKPDRGVTDLDKLKPLPAKGVTNTTLETYSQQSSCVVCHVVGRTRDFQFVFFPSIRALAPPSGKGP